MNNVEYCQNKPNYCFGLDRKIEPKGIIVKFLVMSNTEKTCKKITKKLNFLTLFFYVGNMRIVNLLFTSHIHIK